MTTLTAPLPSAPLPSARTDRDVYRFGDGPTPVLQPGTLGWSADDLEDPEVERLWLAGRYEILNGVLTVMPAAFFQGGAAAANLLLFLHPHVRGRGLPIKVSVEVDIRLRDDHVVRADAVAVIGPDLARFRSVRLPQRRSWQAQPLTVPPSIVIESVSLGHEPHDRQTKRRWYAEFGVPNYWIADAYARRLDCLRLDGGTYVEAGTGTGDDVVRPTAFDGLALPLAEIWNDDGDGDDGVPTPPAG